jgi:tetratricopeptide (TPR) repeat protein
MRCLASTAAAVALGLALMGRNASGGGDRPPPRGGRPSFLLVTLDTTRADHLGAWGWPHARTPALDALARRGVRFARCDAPAPLTLPSHATMLTGELPGGHGVRDNGRFRLPEKATTLAELLAARGYDTAAEVSASVLARPFGLAQGFRRWGEPAGGAHLTREAAERDAVATTDAALDDLRALASPFFLWVHYYDPHWPYRAPDAGATGPTPGYDAELAHLDAELGRLLARLPPDTVVLVAGDHGEMLGEHGEARHGLLPFAAARRVPLLLAGPGVPAGVVRDELVGLADVAPTLLALAGVPAPRDVDGRSLLPLVRGGRLPPRPTYWESFFPYFAYGWYPLRALSDGQVLFVAGPKGTLHRALGNEAALPASAAALARWQHELERVLRRSGETLAQPRLDPQPLAAEAAAQLQALGYAGAPSATPAISPTLPDPRQRVDEAMFLQDAAGRAGPESCRELLARLGALLASEPRNPSARLLAARCHLLVGDAEAALRELRALPREGLAGGQPEPIALSLAADALLAAGRNADASATLARLLALDPADAAAAARWARLERTAGRPQRAREAIAAALAAGADGAELRFEAGMADVALGALADALAAFEAAAALAPADPEPLANAAAVAEKLGDARRAATDYERLLRLVPRRADLWRRLGDLYRTSLAAPGDAHRAYQQALDHETAPARRAELEALLRATATAH